MPQLRYKSDGGPEPGPSAGRRFYFALLLALAGVILIFGKLDNRIADAVRTGMMEAGGGVLAILSRPLEAVRDATESVHRTLFLVEENERLRQENARLRRWVEIARRLENENQRLTALSHVKADIAAPMLTPRAIADSGGPFVRAQLLNAGAQDGLRKGQVVVDENGVIGRTVAVARYSARVLLLTDLNSRVPVLIEGSGVRAILVGDNSDSPVLRYLPSEIRVQPGDRVLTSGEGGVFPPMLPVGRIAAGGATPRVRLFSDLHRLDYVRVLDYNLQNRFDVRDPANLVSAPPAPVNPERTTEPPAGDGAPPAATGPDQPPTSPSPAPPSPVPPSPASPSPASPFNPPPANAETPATPPETDSDQAQ